MSDSTNNIENTPGGSRLKSKAPKEFFNYFGKDRWMHLWFAEKRTRLVSSIVPPLVKIGLVPDTISYIGISFLAGVVLYFVREPIVAVIFLAGHVFFDGVDGAYARHTGKASQSGAFTDLVCDQLGMVIVSLAAIFHHMVSPLIGAVYVTLYLIVVVFGVIINAMGLGTRVTITSKYFLYITYLIWAVWEVNFITELMSFFSVIMAIEVIIGYLRLKRGIIKKFDTQVRFSGADPYSSRLNYALNVAIPLAVLLCILVWGNWIPLRAMIDKPKLAVSWIEGAPLTTLESTQEILGFGVQGNSFLVLVRKEDQTLEVRRLPEGAAKESFVVPEYVSPMFRSFPVDGNVMLIPDGSTRLLMGIDLEASFAAKRAVMVLTLPFQYLRCTAMAVGDWRGRKVWFAANYLYTRRTYVIDPEKSLKKGFVLGGLVASYTNGGFPSGMAAHEKMIFEYNESPFEKLIYAVPLKRVIAGSNLLDVQSISFSVPCDNAMGPAIDGDDLVVLSPQGKIYRLPLKALSPKKT